jgi:hypothetical protein
VPLPYAGGDAVEMDDLGGAVECDFQEGAPGWGF